MFDFLRDIGENFRKNAKSPAKIVFFALLITTSFVNCLSTRGQTTMLKKNQKWIAKIRSRLRKNQQLYYREGKTKEPLRVSSASNNGYSDLVV